MTGFGTSRFSPNSSGSGAAAGTGSNPTGPAGGDLGGSYPNPTLASSQVNVVSIAPTNNALQITGSLLQSSSAGNSISGLATMVTGSIIASSSTTHIFQAITTQLTGAFAASSSTTYNVSALTTAITGSLINSASSFSSFSALATQISGNLVISGSGGSSGTPNVTIITGSLLVSSSISNTFSALSSIFTGSLINSSSTYNRFSALVNQVSGNIIISGSNAIPAFVSLTGSMSITGSGAGGADASPYAFEVSGGLRVSNTLFVTGGINATNGSGRLDLDAQVINIGTSIAPGVTLGRSGQATTVQGTLTSNQDVRYTGATTLVLTGTAGGGRTVVANWNAVIASMRYVIANILSGSNTIIQVTGLQGGVAGKEITIFNASTSSNIEFTKMDASSPQATQFILPASGTTIPPSGSISFHYFSAGLPDLSNYWICTSIVDLKAGGLLL